MENTQMVTDGNKKLQEHKRFFCELNCEQFCKQKKSQKNRFFEMVTPLMLTNQISNFGCIAFYAAKFSFFESKKKLPNGNEKLQKLQEEKCSKNHFFSKIHQTEKFSVTNLAV